MFSPFFALRIAAGEYEFRVAQRWARRIRPRITELDILLFPVLDAKSHWTLVIADLRLGLVKLCDPWHAFNTRQAAMLTALSRWISEDHAELTKRA